MEVLKEKGKDEALRAGASKNSKPILKVAYFKEGIYSTDINELSPEEQLEIFQQLVSIVSNNAIVKHDVQGEMRVIKGALVGRDENFIYIVRSSDKKVFQINYKNIRSIEMNNFSWKSEA